MEASMGHDHHDHHGHDHHHHHGSGGVGAAFFLNLIFAIIEFAGGLFTNSVAIMSDALHDLGDSAALGFSWIMERLSRKGSSDKLTFGYRRFSVLGALFSSLVLISGSVFIISEAVQRILHPEEVMPEGMLPLAIIGVGVNLIAAVRLKKEGGDHLNQRVIMLHLLEDALGWIAVLIVSIVLFFVDIPVLDPVLSLVITLFVLTRVFPRLLESLRVFLQYSPENLELQQIRTAIRGSSGVADVHDTHLWSIDGREHIFSAHVVLKDNMNLAEMEKIKQTLKNELESLGVNHSTIEFELVDTVCKSCRE